MLNPLCPGHIFGGPIRVDFLYNSSRVSNSDNPVRDILGDYTSSSNSDTITDSDSGNDDDTSSDPAVVTDFDTLGPFRTLETVSFFGREGVGRSVDLSVGA